jgi:hypothetical protein
MKIICYQIILFSVVDLKICKRDDFYFQSIVPQNEVKRQLI